jgi:hypothetical protein
MRQKRIISYQDLEARIEYLEVMVTDLYQFIQTNTAIIDELRLFLETTDRKVA